jgi:prepilin-type N-terminal cleavage/methylation domain-containing protein
VVRRRRAAGFTLLEVIIALTVFGVFLMILMMLTVEMRGYEKRLPVNFMRHPQTIALISRMRRDVLDAYGKNPFDVTIAGYTQTEKTLLLQSVQENGGIQQIIWDFRTSGVAKRTSINVGIPTVWTANGVPDLMVDAVENPDGTYGVRLMATDKKGKLAIDQIFQPRAHQ